MPGAVALGGAEAPTILGRIGTWTSRRADAPLLRDAAGGVRAPLVASHSIVVALLRERSTSDVRLILLLNISTDQMASLGQGMFRTDFVTTCCHRRDRH